MMQHKRKQSGMTLIEVLIASLVLFIAIGSISGVHRTLNYYQRLNLVDYALMLNQHSFMDYLSYALSEKIYNGSYQAGEYEIIWQAEVSKEAGVVTGWNPESGDSANYSTRGSVALYDVSFYFVEFPSKKYDVTQLVVNDEKELRF